MDISKEIDFIVNNLNGELNINLAPFTCAILKERLRSKYNINTKIIGGYLVVNNKLYMRHCWVQLQDGTNVDIAYEVWKKKNPQYNNLPSSLHKELTDDIAKLTNNSPKNGAVLNNLNVAIKQLENPTGFETYLDFLFFRNREYYDIYATLIK